MARKIILKENGLSGSGNAPDGYKYLGDSVGSISEKVGATVSAIGGSSEWLTLETPAFNHSQILTMGSSPLPILPNVLASNEWYDVESIISLRKGGGYTYTLPANSLIQFNQLGPISSTLLGYSDGSNTWVPSNIWKGNYIYDTINLVVYNNHRLVKDTSAFIYSFTNPTGGAVGEFIKFIVRYRIVTIVP